ncbi:hypothetical protein GCM10011506_01910 [Marivirga lumbricoides]|uniref:Peptidase A2 domain-containing protein n=2 Tax=Marivirga lumbricoides TaxID=1046115 RepID=A0ABQ1L7Z0_9BACT|nr:hypothetical protein GCM10011506_01910 [Marivirga lumbricoides]
MGEVQPQEFGYKTEFKTLKTLLVLPFKINGVEKNFLFDTGAELCIIQRDSVKGEAAVVSGASGNSSASGTEVVKSLKFGDVNFVNIFALNTNMAGIQEQISNFGGLIGQSVINKANWLIDYPEKTIEVSNRDLSDNTFETLNITFKNSRPYTFISIEGKKEKVMLDFGSSRKFIVPENTELAKTLLSRYEFKDQSRLKSNMGKSETVIEKTAILPLIKLGSIDFKNVEVTVGNSKNMRIGISFFEDYQVYIDNLNNSYKIKASFEARN